MDLESSKKPMIPEDEIPSLSNWTCRIIERRNLTILNSKVTIFRHKLYNCDIIDSSIDDCSLYNCKVQNAKNLFNVQFHNCEIINSKAAADVKFHNCRIQDAKKVFNAQFHDCEIRNSKMINARLYDCRKIEGCQVTRAILEDSDLSIWKIYIRNCQLSNCRVEEGRIVRSKLENGYLDRCEVETTTVTGAQVQNCDLLWCDFSKGTSLRDSHVRDGSISQPGDVTWDLDTQISKAAVGFEKFPLEIVQEIFQYALTGEGKKIPLLDAVRGHKVFHEVALKALGSYRRKSGDSETNGIESAVLYIPKDTHQLFRRPRTQNPVSQELSLGNTNNQNQFLAPSSLIKNGAERLETGLEREASKCKCDHTF
ncbi:hypothetical protein HYFRA_00007989 [Hymenoscyphus fraxineus]|uniref:Uncharacterized protein n=1 Tax=Hymenoscyphus fraxineus TaxID=746836 RepID=A0A9N9KQF5_9HELO|nr:hypothetical protein HYFRA_00007989 [Hymenoscyphus fraxineus]